MGSFAEFERERIRERIHAGLARARGQGQKLGRKRQPISERDLQQVARLSVREAARLLGVPASLKTAVAWVHGSGAKAQPGA